jgi:outer membrane protein TolC
MRRRTKPSVVARALLGVAAVALAALPARPQAPAELPPPQPVPPHLVLTAGGAVQWALEHSPELATWRAQRGIAQANVVISRQYPFNPIAQHFVWYDNGPESSGVTNHVFNEDTVRLDLEIRHQGTYRRAMARAALTRTDWEIAAQELLVSVRVARAFNALLYRRAKLALANELVQLQDEAVKQVGDMVEQGKLNLADLYLARADAAEGRNLLGPAHALVVTAGSDLRRALGLLQEELDVEGTLETGLVKPQVPELVQAALERRPDLHALEFAVQEAEQRLRLEVANRFGNPSLGPAFEYNETSVYFVGMWLVWSPPVLNTRKGEIQLRQAERARAIQAVQQSEVAVQQDVYAAQARLAEAEGVADRFRTQLLPELRRTRDAIDRLLAQNQLGADLARALDVRRRLLRSRDAYLDALFEVSQARVDLAAAVADLSLAACNPSPPPPAPPPPPPPPPPSPPPPHRKARSSPSALCNVSAYSPSGVESATTPPPTGNWYQPRPAVNVRIRMLVSIEPSKPT